MIGVTVLIPDAKMSAPAPQEKNGTVTQSEPAGENAIFSAAQESASKEKLAQRSATRKKRRRNRKIRNGFVLLAVLFTVAVIAALVWSAKRQLADDFEDLAYPRTYRETVAREAEAFDLPESLIFAVIKAESNFDPEAQSSAGALGLMQIMPETFTWMQGRLGESYDGTEALFEPDVNIRYGAACLRLMLDTFDGELSTALAAYNAGPGNVANWLLDTAYSDDGRTLKSIPFDETARYVEKVLQYKQSYDETYYGGM